MLQDNNIDEGCVFNIEKNCWYVSSLDYVKAILFDDEHFSAKAYSLMCWPDIAGINRFFSLSGKNHVKHRKVFNRVFNKRLDLIETDILAPIAKRLAGALNQGVQIDLVREYVFPYFEEAISGLVGISVTDTRGLVAYLKTTVSFVEKEHDPARIEAAITCLWNYVEDVFASYSQQSTTSQLGLIQFNNKYRSSEYFLNLNDLALVSMRLFYALAYQVSTDLIATTLRFVAQAEVQLQEKILREYDQCYIRVIDESLRLQEGREIPRLCVQDQSVGDINFKRNDQIILLVSESGQDQDYFSEPKAFNPWRDNLDHVLVWGFGKHSCIGKKIGQIIGKVALYEILNQFGSMQYHQYCGERLIVSLGKS